MARVLISYARSVKTSPLCVSCGSDCWECEEGTIATLTATPVPGYKSSGGVGGSPGEADNTGPWVLTLDADKSTLGPFNLDLSWRTLTFTGRDLKGRGSAND
jgi:hypothetical protein